MSIYPRNVPRCQHIKINGIQCGSPALRGQRLCFFHNRWRETRIPFNKEGALHFVDAFELPMLEDPESVQVAITQVLRLIIAKHIDHKTAGLLLYGLQTASCNLKRTKFDPLMKDDVVIDPETVGRNPLDGKAWDRNHYTPPPVEKDDLEKHEDEPAVEPELQKPAEVEIPEPQPAPIAALPAAAPPRQPILRAIPAPPGASKEMKNLAYLLETMDKLEAMDRSG
ncbi:MAG TPA: hypothetical protein VMB18_00820 [Terriglobales bacterium]|nr:hypothetical protein [Terriglobales bacterium]